MSMHLTSISLDSLYRSQFGEDRILWDLFLRKTDGWFVEVGAYDGVTLSNTYFLEQVGWSGVLVEPIFPLCQTAAASRQRSRVIHAACGKRGSSGTATFTIAQNVPVLSFLTADDEHKERCRREGAQFIEVQVPILSVDDVLRDAREHPQPDRGPWTPNFGWDIDLVSIDTEGSELDVLEGFNLERYRPRVLLMENDRPSGARIEQYLTQRGYRKIHRQQINDFYARNDAVAELNLHGLNSSTASQ